MRMPWVLKMNPEGPLHRIDNPLFNWTPHTISQAHSAHCATEKIPLKSFALWNLYFFTKMALPWSKNPDKDFKKCNKADIWVLTKELANQSRRKDFRRSWCHYSCWNRGRKIFDLCNARNCSRACRIWGICGCDMSIEILTKRPSEFLWNITELSCSQDSEQVWRFTEAHALTLPDRSQPLNLSAVAINEDNHGRQNIHWPCKRHVLDLLCLSGMLVAQPLLQETISAWKISKKNCFDGSWWGPCHWRLENWILKGLWQARNTEDYYGKRDSLASTHWDMLNRNLPDNIPHVGHGRRETILWDWSWCRPS